MQWMQGSTLHPDIDDKIKYLRIVLVAIVVVWIVDDEWTEISLVVCSEWPTDIWVLVDNRIVGRTVIFVEVVSWSIIDWMVANDNTNIDRIDHRRFWE